MFNVTTRGQIVVFWLAAYKIFAKLGRSVDYNMQPRLECWRLISWFSYRGWSDKQEPLQQLFERSVAGLLKAKCVCLFNISLVTQALRIFPKRPILQDLPIVCIVKVCSRLEHAWHVYHWTLSKQHSINLFNFYVLIFAFDISYR